MSNINLKVCRVCLSPDGLINNFNRCKTSKYYEEISNIKMDEEKKLPEYFCFECLHMLQKCHRFKEKCLTSHKIMLEMQWCSSLTYESIKKVDREKLQLSSTLRTCSISNISYLQIIDNDDRVVNETEETGTIDNLGCIPKTEVTDDIRYTDNKYIGKVETTDNDINIDNIVIEKTENSTDSDLGLSDINQEIFCEALDKLYETKLTERRNRRKKGQYKKKQTFNVLSNSSNWKVCTLTEEEAKEMFENRAYNEKYIQASFKCSHCMKWFSSQDIMQRHMEIKHAEWRGNYVCNFCQVRTKYVCTMRNHIKDHYTKFKCMRCDVIFSSEKSALHHEESHSGVKKKCVYCDKTFRHISTYYSHLRKHRSGYICPTCGKSFVSGAGLRQHKVNQHRWQSEAPQDEDDSTYCERCGIDFDSRCAFDKHFFHSALHGDDEIGDRGSATPELKLLKKIQGKRRQKILSSRLNDISTDFLQEKIKPVKKKGKIKKYSRPKIKPTTCYQCGESFPTQAACMKHHRSAHSGTSFYSPKQRYICEICGVNLAPGSMVSHQNLHTKEKVHPCPHCGKKFYARVALNRHILIHTGEKPFKCIECDKRFTQSNSMKLHYRTVHLKQPHPKRSRSKKKDSLEDLPRGKWNDNDQTVPS